SQCDFILCIGSDFEGEESAVEADLNAQIAKQLGCPVLIVSRGDRRNVAHVQNMVRATLDIFQAAGCHVVGIVVNRTQPENMTALTAVLQESLAEEQIFPAVLPADPHLSSPTLSEIVEQLNLEVLYGEDQLHRLAYHNLIVAMQVRNYLPYLRENALLITAGDRDDIVLSALQAHQSRSYPRLAGIVLTGGLKPSETVTRLIDGLEDVAPIF